MEVVYNGNPDNVSSHFFLKHLAWINVFWTDIGCICLTMSCAKPVRRG